MNNIPFHAFTFKDRQEYSERYTADLDKFYHTIWHIDKIEVVEDKERQIKGVDKILYTEDGKKIYIDEKVESIKNSSNIVFEDKTDIDRGIAGWLKEGQWTNFLVFYQVNMNKIYLIPFKEMLSMYNEYKGVWMEQGLDRVIINKTDNGYYRGRIFIVPKTEVFDYLKSHNIINSYDEFEFPTEILK